MRTTAKKLLSILLLVAMLVPCLSVFRLPTGAAASNIANVMDAKGLDFTSNTYIAEKLDELFALLPYSNYPYFTSYGNKSCGNSQCTACSLKAVSTTHPNLKNVGLVDTYTSYSCFAFARYAFYYIFGVAGDGLNYYGNPKGNNMQVYNRIGASTGMPTAVQGEYGPYESEQDLKNFFSKAETGDIIQGMSKYNSSTKKYSNHSMIFLSCDEEGIYVLQNNAFRSSTGPDGNIFGYNRVLVSYITYARFRNTWGQLVTDFRARQDIFDATMAKGETVCNKHVYTPESMESCINCAKRFQPILRPEDAGIYRTTTVASGFAKPYLLSEVKNDTAEGTLVEVTASLVNSLGQTWYLRPDGSYFYGGSLKKQTNDPSITVDLTSAPKGELILGNSFNIAGTVKAGEKIVRTAGMLCKSDGTVLSRITIAPNVNSFSLLNSNINLGLKFGSLSAGEHRFFLAVHTESGKTYFYHSEFTMVKKIKEKPAAPSAPTLEYKDSYSVVLKTEPGYEYSVGGSVWKTVGRFDGLLPMTEYTFYRRLSETEENYASDRSPALTVTTLPPPAPTPEAPTVQALTDTTVTLILVDGMEYSMDGTTWFKSPLFSSLSPNTVYFFYCRVAATATNSVSEASPALSVTTAKKSVTQIPSAPIALERSPNSITLASVKGYEYRMNGGKWQTSPTFTGLSLNTEYTFTCRIAETADTAASGESTPAKIRTTKNPNKTKPEAPTAAEITATSVTLAAKPGYEYRMNNGAWQTNPTFISLDPYTAYTFYCRVAETDTVEASAPSAEAVIVTKKQQGQKADAPKVLTYTPTSVTLVRIAGMEYRVDGGKWQADPTFTGLTPGRHVFTQRYAETQTSYAGAESKELVQYTLPQSLTSDLIHINEEKKLIGSLAEGMKYTVLTDCLDDTNGLSIYRGSKKITDLSTAVATGDVLKVEDETGRVYCSYTVVVRGDVNGDGRVNITDMLQVKADVRKQKPLTGCYAVAGDVSGDGRISILDFIQIKLSILEDTDFEPAPIK